MQRRPLGAVVAAAGLAALVVVLLATPDSQIFVFVAWVVVLAGVAALALGIAIGFRHQTRVDEASAPRHYLTADWVGGAQLFTVGDRAEPPIPEPTPDPIAEPVDDPELPPSVLPHPPSEPEVRPVGRYPRVAAALMVANAVRDLTRLLFAKIDSSGAEAPLALNEKEARSGQAEQVGNAVIAAREIAAVDGDGLARDEGGVG